MEETNSTGNTFDGFRFFFRILLSLAITSLLIASLLTLMTSTSANYSFNFFSIFFSFYVLLFSIVGIIGIVLYKVLKNEPVWNLVQREVLLCCATGCGLLHLGFVTNYIANN